MHDTHEENMEMKGEVSYSVDTQQDREPPDQDEVMKTTMEQMESGKTSMNGTLKELGAVQDYIKSEGAIMRNAPRCESCLTACKGCVKASRLSPKDEQVLKEMTENITKEVKEDGSIQFIVNYVFSECPKQAFFPQLSNYSSALRQARNNYYKLLKSDEGLPAVREMMRCGFYS